MGLGHTAEKNGKENKIKVEHYKELYAIQVGDDGSRHVIWLIKRRFVNGESTIVAVCGSDDLIDGAVESFDRCAEILESRNPGGFFPSEPNEREINVHKGGLRILEQMKANKLGPFTEARSINKSNCDYCGRRGYMRPWGKNKAWICRSCGLSDEHIETTLDLATEELLRDHMVGKKPDYVVDDVIKEQVKNVARDLIKQHAKELKEYEEKQTNNPVSFLNELPPLRA